MVVTFQEIPLSARAGIDFVHSADPNLAEDLNFMRDNACVFCAYWAGSLDDAKGAVCMGPITKNQKGQIVIFTRDPTIKIDCRITNNTELT